MIIKSAYLALLHYGAMAKVIFKDGSESQILATKRQALEITEAMLGIKLDEFELKAIKEQIYSSHLISRNTGLEEFCNQTQNDLDTLKRKLDAIFDEMDELDDKGEEWKNN